MTALEIESARIRGLKKRNNKVRAIMHDRGCSFREASLILKGNTLGTGVKTAPKKTMSAAARKKISDAMKARHARMKSGASPTPAPTARDKHEKLILFVSGGIFKLCALNNGNGEIKVKDVDFEVVKL